MEHPHPRRMSYTMRNFCDLLTSRFPLRPASQRPSTLLQPTGCSQRQKSSIAEKSIHPPNKLILINCSLIWSQNTFSNIPISKCSKIQSPHRKRSKTESDRTLDRRRRGSTKTISVAFDCSPLLDMVELGGARLDVDGRNDKIGVVGILDQSIVGCQISRTDNMRRPTDCWTLHDACRNGKHSRRHTLVHTDFDEEIIDGVDRKLFSRLPNLDIVYIISSPKTSTHWLYSLRKRRHYYQWPQVEYLQYKNSFINRCLLNFQWL